MLDLILGICGILIALTLLLQMRYPGFFVRRDARHDWPAPLRVFLAICALGPLAAGIALMARS